MTRDVEKLAQTLQYFIDGMIDTMLTQTGSKIIEIDPIICATMAKFPEASEQTVTERVFQQVEKRGYGVFWRNAHHPVSGEKDT